MPYSKYSYRNHSNDTSRKSSISSLSSDSSSDSGHDPKLLYGFGEQRYEYEKETDDEYIYIDHLNNALGITLDNLVSNDKITDIKNGIVVTPLHVWELKKSIIPQISFEEAEKLLQSWANHIKDNFKSISISERLNKRSADDFRFEFINKNIIWNEDVKINEITHDFGINDSFDNNIRKIIKKFRSSDSSGFKFLDKAYKLAEKNKETAELALLYESVANTFINAFFRKTSKAGLDWAFGIDAPVPGVDFLTYANNTPFTEEDLKKKTYKSTAGYSGEHRTPITFSELRYAAKNNFKINKITQAIRSKTSG